MDYDELYEYLRKEKYSEQLQTLPRTFLSQISDYFKEKRKELTSSDNFFSDGILAEKRQLENAVSIFKELILRRKKKILNLVFVASETGIMKRDFGSMLDFERELFERLVSSVDKADKELNDIMVGRDKKEDTVLNKMVIIDQDIEEFVDMNGNPVGPFVSGHLANLDVQIADLLVAEGKARAIDE